MLRDSSPDHEILRVKLLLRPAWGRETANLLRRFPGGEPVWGRCRFIFDCDARHYDWFVAYDDLPSAGGERFGMRQEVLACPRARTLLVTSEPSTIKSYGSRFLAQFGHVLTSQEPWAVRHPGAIFSQPALLWFYGRTDERGSHDHMVNHPPVDKTAIISTVCSSKQQRHTLHQSRFEFVQKMCSQIPELEVFGHGVRPIHDKAEALDSYRYHIAIENHLCPHHWTEKLADAFLGLCLPFYHGCPNATDYFPAESFIPIDIRNPGESAERIRKAIRDDEYTRHLPALLEARRRVLEEYGLFAVLSRIIEARHASTAGSPELQPEARILSRRALRLAHPTNLLADLWEKYRLSARHRLNRPSR